MKQVVLPVGAPMWKLPAWNDRYFGKVTAGSELAAYASWCSAVEGNTTFYASPSPATVARWGDQVPAGFQFCFKLPRAITHDRRLRQSADELRTFLTLMEPLGDRLGPFWVQLPASFGPDSIPVLDAFVRQLSTNVDWAVELRHEAFAADGDAEREVNDLLHAQGVDRIHLDSRAFFAGPRETPEEIDAWGKKPRLKIRPVALAHRPTLRFIGQTDGAANPPFWAPWVAKVATWLIEGRRPVVFIHTPDNVVSPELARQFHAEVEVHLRQADADITLAPLPTPTKPEQASLDL